MSIPISGGPYVMDDVSASSGTVVRDFVNDSLVAAGWTSSPISGGFDVQSATTPQGLNVIVKLLSTPSWQFRSTDGSKTGSTGPFQTGAFTYRIIANPYQFFVFVPGFVSTFNPSYEVMGGVPFVPSFLTSVTSDLWWAMGSPSFRANIFPSPVISNFAFNSDLGSGAGTGSPRIYQPIHGGVGSGSVNIVTQWFNGANVVADSLIGWGLSSGGNPRVRGLLWDCATILGAYTMDLEDNFEGHNWYNITSSNTAGSLWLIVP